MQLLPGVLARGQLEVPALVITADATPERDLVLDEPQVLGVEIGGAEVDPSGIGCPPAAELGQAAQLRQDEVGADVVFLLGWSPLLLITP